MGGRGIGFPQIDSISQVVIDIDVDDNVRASGDSHSREERKRGCALKISNNHGARFDFPNSARRAKTQNL